MNKLMFLFILPVVLFAQPEFIGELQIQLINKGSSWNVTIALTAVSDRWDQYYQLTEQYDYLYENVVNEDEYAYFDHVRGISGDLPVFAMGLYKISAIENGIERAWFYMDWRTTNGAQEDVSFKYDVINGNFRNWANTETINYSYQTEWDLTICTLITVGFEDYWAHSLALVGTVNNNPWLIWGTYPSDYFVESNYKIYKKKGTQSFEPYDTPIDPNYIDTEETIVTGPPVANETLARYKVSAVGIQRNNEIQIETEASNEVEARINGDPPEKLSILNLSQEEYSLLQNYPNPFNPSTIITWTTPTPEFINLKVYDILGREIAELVNEQREAGVHSVEFNASELSSGVYIYRIQIGEYIQARNLVIQK